MSARLYLLLLAFVWPSHAEEARPAKPNIIIMMADDMGVGDTSAYLGVSLNGNSESITRTLRTPNLEDFAKSAVVFTDAYAPASMCSSTRYSLLTGRFAHRAYLKNQGWLPHGPNTPMIQKAMPTLPLMLQRNGYATAGVGKYHVGMTFDDGHGEVADEYDFSDVDFTLPFLDGPTHHGFDEYFGVTGNTEDPLDLEPRVYIRNNGWSFTNRSRMQLIGMKDREGRVLAMPEWDLANLGEDYLKESTAFIERQGDSGKPFFLYYVPNANHFQRHPGGDYAVPEQLAGEAVNGASRYSGGTPAGDREDMVLENDLAFGKLLETLRETEDARWPGHRLIENTLVIFTSDNGPNVGDNLSTNQESGGLKGKKAKIWEGGIRVPLLVYWKDHIEGGQINRSVTSHSDFYATLASVIGHSLLPNEAQDSHDSLAYWTGETKGRDERARVFFCHLGPPYSNDALAMRVGSEKLLVDGGLALPSIEKGQRGASVPIGYYDLDSNLYEDGEGIEEANSARAEELAAELLKIHNRGYARELDVEAGDEMIVDPGWHNLRNDITGEIGFEFSVSVSKQVTHLGVWDDHDKDVPVRPARSIPTEFNRDQPTLAGDLNRRRLNAGHIVRLVHWTGDSAREIARIAFTEENRGQLSNEFRFLALTDPVPLLEGERYGLLMTTVAGDGDSFHDAASFDGLSPIAHPDVSIIRSLMARGGDLSAMESIPAFEDLHPSFDQERMMVGPSLRFQ